MAIKLVLHMHESDPAVRRVETEAAEDNGSAAKLDGDAGAVAGAGSIKEDEVPGVNGGGNVVLVSPLTSCGGVCDCNLNTCVRV